jgi:outer membrane protein OmpA-like peptidoglycan-associated protein
VALRLKQDPALTALVIGYSDSSGSDAGNQSLSERRAQAVKDYLVTRHGIDPGRITTEGRGSGEPVGDNATEEGRRENRRAVIVLSAGG